MDRQLRMAFWMLRYFYLRSRDPASVATNQSTDPIMNFYINKEAALVYKYQGPVADILVELKNNCILKWSKL